MATKLKVNYEFVGDSTTPVTRTESIKHGDSMLSTVINAAAATVNTKADKSYVDTELAKKANAADVTTALSGKADNTTVSALDSRVGTAETNIATQTARIDEIASLPEGSTTGDAELIDIRVGADGKTYTSAGNAVRGQISDVKSDLNKVKAEVTKVYGSKTITSTSSFGTNYDFKAGKKYTVTLENTENISSIGVNLQVNWSTVQQLGYLTEYNRSISFVCSTNADMLDAYVELATSSSTNVIISVAETDTLVNELDKVKLNIDTIESSLSEAESDIDEIEGSLTVINSDLNKVKAEVLKTFAEKTINSTSSFGTAFNFESGKKYTVTLENTENISSIGVNLQVNWSTVQQLGYLTEYNRSISFVCSANADMLDAYVELIDSASTNVIISIVETESVVNTLNNVENDVNTLKYEVDNVEYEIFGLSVTGNISSQSSVMGDVDIKSGETYLIKLNSSDNIYSISIYGQVNWSTVQEIGTLYPGSGINTIVFTANVNIKQLNLYTTLVENVSTNVDVSFYIKDSLSYQVHNKPVIKELLVIGDSYSYGGAYIEPLRDKFIIKGITNLGVVNATLKDKYSDRTTYPYTSNPVQTDNEGNHNTFACQIEKLKLNSEYLNHNPDVIFIQGGHNDSPDATTTNYMNQLVEYKENVYFGNELKNGYIPKPIENTDRTTFAGSLYYIITTLKSWYPTSKIYVITPSGLSYENGGNYLTYIDKANQMKTACQWLSCPYIDWSVFGNCNFTHVSVSGNGTQDNPYVLTAGNEMSDLLHPNAYGGELLSDPIIKELLK